MRAEDLVLNMAVNLGRVSRWSTEGRIGRISQFLAETEGYLKQLESHKISNKFKPTLQRFIKELDSFKNQSFTAYDFAEQVLTWANILQHRAKLA